MEEALLEGRGIFPRLQAHAGLSAYSVRCSRADFGLSGLRGAEGPAHGVRRVGARLFCSLSFCGVAGSAVGLAAVFDGKDADGVGDAGLEADAPVTDAEAALAEVLTLEVLDVALAGLGVAGEVAEDTHRGFTVDGAEVGAGVR